MSYRKRHVKSTIHRIKPRKSIFKKLWFWILILLLIIIFSAFYFTLFYSGIQVKNVFISGNENINTQELQDMILNNANTGLLRFWNLQIISKSILLVDTGKLDKEILQKYPAIEKVSINKNFPQTLSLVITERKPIGIFCEDADNCFLLDRNGIAYEPASSASPNFTVVRQAINSRQVFTGEEVISQSIINTISEIQKDLKDNFNIDLKEALVASPVRLNAETNENWQIYFDLSAGSDVNLQLTELNLLLNGGISATSRKNLKYIDLRPKDRAIVCDNKECGPPQ